MEPLAAVGVESSKRSSPPASCDGSSVADSIHRDIVEHVDKQIGRLRDVIEMNNVIETNKRQKLDVGVSGLQDQLIALQGELLHEKEKVVKLEAEAKQPKMHCLITAGLTRDNVKANVDPSPRTGGMGEDETNFVIDCIHVALNNYASLGHKDVENDFTAFLSHELKKDFLSHEYFVFAGYHLTIRSTRKASLSVKFSTKNEFRIVVLR